jgi:hypothetical protein
MIVDDLTKGLRNRLDEIFSIKNSLSILNIPKQDLLDKGEIVILLNDKNKPIIVEFLKVGKYHIELKNNQFPKLLVESILKSEKIKLFESSDFDAEFDTDQYINYGDLTAEQKKDIKIFMKTSVSKLCEEHKRFGKMSDDSLKKTIGVQNGIFTIWMKENGFDTPNKECLKEAYKVSQASNDMLLKKRAVAAKCFHKIYMEKMNVGK